MISKKNMAARGRGQFPYISILGQSYNANDISKADIENTIHPKFTEFVWMSNKHFSYIITNHDKIQNMQMIENTRRFFKLGQKLNFTDIDYGFLSCLD